MTNPQREFNGAVWRKSSHSGSGDQCVEVATLSRGHHAVRDSKDPAGPALVLTPSAWWNLLSAIKEV